MATNPAQSRYLADSVSTATPAQLVVMLYDRLGLDLRRAEETFDVVPAGEPTPLDTRIAAAEHLLHAQQIVSELLASLRTELWAEGEQLGGLYGFLIRELTAVNLEPDLKRLRHCASIVTGLRSAWAEAAAQLASESAARSASSPGAWVA